MWQANPNELHGGLEQHPEEPSCGDEVGIDNARRGIGNPADYIGDIGGIGACVPGGYTGGDYLSDSGACCHVLALTWVPGIGAFNRKPVVEIESPAQNAVFGPFSNVTFGLHTLDVDGRVWRVDWNYRVDGGPKIYLAPTYSPMFGLNATNVPPGTYDVEAVGYDTADQYTISSTRRVVVLPPPSGPSVLVSGAILYPNEVRTNGSYYVRYEAVNGNFVLYGPQGGIIGTGTGLPAGGVYMNPNGALEVYNVYQQLLWSSGTASGANAGSHMRVESYGKLSIVRPNGSIVIQWP